jgi:hypothetical protein
MNALSKLPVFTPTSSFSTPSHSRTAASRATFFLRRCSSMPFIAFSRSCFVRTLPPTTFLNKPLIALKPDPTSPLGDSVLASAFFLASASARMEWTSSPSSFNTNFPFVLDPHVEASTSSTAPGFPPASTSLSLVNAGTE